MKYLSIFFTIFCFATLSAGENSSIQENIEEIEQLFFKDVFLDEVEAEVYTKSDQAIASLSEEEYPQYLELFYYRAHGKMCLTFEMSEEETMETFKESIRDAVSDLQFIMSQSREMNALAKAACVRLKFLEGFLSCPEKEDVGFYVSTFKQSMLQTCATKTGLTGNELVENVYENISNNPHLKEFFFDLIKFFTFDPLIELGKVKEMESLQFSLEEDDEFVEDESLFLVVEFVYRDYSGNRIEKAIYL